MKKVYVKPSVVLDEEELELSCILCASVIPPGENNTPAGARSHAGWDDAWDDAMSRGSIWDEEDEE
jgi:hypothetical protein